MSKTKKILITIGLSLLIGLGVYVFCIETTGLIESCAEIKHYGFKLVSIFPRKNLQYGFDVMFSWTFTFSILLIILSIASIALSIVEIIRVLKSK